MSEEIQTSRPWYVAEAWLIPMGAALVAAGAGLLLPESFRKAVLAAGGVLLVISIVMLMRRPGGAAQRMSD